MKPYTLHTLWLVIIGALLTSTTLYAQNDEGKKLFKSYCAACHKMDQKLVGPPLQGVVQKWEEAGEGDLLVEWIKNPEALYKSGKSKMAKAAWELTPTMMTPTPGITDEQIHLIIDYLKNWKPKEKPAATTASPSTTTTKVTVVENKAMTKFLFVSLLVLTAIILIGIIVIFKMLYNLLPKNISTTHQWTIPLLLSFGLSASPLRAATPMLSWLDQVSRVEVYILLAIDIVLLLTLLYLWSMLKKYLQER